MEEEDDDDDDVKNVLEPDKTQGKT